MKITVNKSAVRCFSAMLLAMPVFGGAILPDGSYHEFQFGTATSAVFSCAGGCDATSNPIAEQTSSPPWTFTTAGPATLFVLDLFFKGDRFQFFDNLVSVGTTSVVANTGVNSCSGDIACATADAGYSRLSVALSAGAHSLTGSVIANATGASAGGAAVFSVATSAVPEPGTMVLIGLGGVLLAGSPKLRRPVRNCR